MLRATELAGFIGAGLAGAAYVPQIWHLTRERCSAGLSRAAFSVWLAASLLVTTHAVAIRATVFIALGAIQLAATALILIYTIKYANSFCASHPPVSLLSGPVDGSGEPLAVGIEDHTTARDRHRIAMQSQSGALGIAILERSARIWLSVSSFVSVGNKADVSGNDLLQFWEDDPGTDVVLLYLESFGNPRKFARIARRVSRRKPIVAVKSGRSAAGVRAASSHTAVMTSPDIAVDALFRQAGVIRVDTLDELFDMAVVLAPSRYRPGTAWPSSAIREGRESSPPTPATGLDSKYPSCRRRPRRRCAPWTIRTPPGRTPSTWLRQQPPRCTSRRSALCLPTTASMRPSRSALLPSRPRHQRSPTCSDGVPRPRTSRCSAASSPGPTCLRRTWRKGRCPAFASPEPAAQALARAASYAAWRTRSPGAVPAEVVDDLLSVVGVRTVTSEAVGNAAEATRAAARLGIPVALKASGPQLVHKSDMGGVRLGLRSEDEVADAYGSMTDHIGGRMTGGRSNRWHEPA